MDIKSQQDADYFETLKKDKEKLTKFYEEAFKVPEIVPEIVPEVIQEVEVKLTPTELRQARIRYFTN